MEQHRTSQPQGRRRPQTPLTPPGALVEGASVYRVAARTGQPGRGRVERAVPVRPVRARPVPPVVLAVRRLPNPRLTGLGAGLFASATMLVLGFLDWLILDGQPIVYGLLFLPVSALTALWVRTADLVTAPISVPIAFAVGVVPISGGTAGFGGQAMAVVTALAVHAGWLYGGTLVAGLIASVRKVRDMGRRQRAAALRGQAARRPAP
ncbi:hypothetical protein J7E93_01790 [Streptomyces sp. ISL-36]|uniref:DUF6542 domain-containing protein n=1 Tax=Streptomyces sp. ISL-36 TaxID=2819182 RepID=UPI001BEBA0FE|nr:DUF6542 domain-containing protein [Streptomyces sp. ISL-36]MBT2438877.1 hypothetical protein [Streptomyces sp. ISL-36]